MDRLFSSLGKAIFFIIIGVVLVGAGYLLASKFGPKGVSKNQSVSQASPANPPHAPVVNSTPAAKTPFLKTITAGLPKSAKLSYYQYAISVPDDWTINDQKDLSVPTDKLIISNGSYQFSIYQAATGGALCVYPGDPTPEGPAGLYGSYTEFTGNDKITYRRGMIDSTNISTQNFGICARVQNTSFGEPSPFGHILYQAPKTYDTQILDQMDKIVASLTRVI